MLFLGPKLQGGYICCYQGLGPTSPGWTVVALVVGLVMWEFRLEVQGGVCRKIFLKMCDLWKIPKASINNWRLGMTSLKLFLKMGLNSSDLLKCSHLHRILKEINDMGPWETCWRSGLMSFLFLELMCFNNRQWLLWVNCLLFCQIPAEGWAGLWSKKMGNPYAVGTVKQCDFLEDVVCMHPGFLFTILPLYLMFVCLKTQVGWFWVGGSRLIQPTQLGPGWIFSWSRILLPKIWRLVTNLCLNKPLGSLNKPLIRHYFQGMYVWCTLGGDR